MSNIKKSMTLLLCSMFLILPVQLYAQNTKTVTLNYEKRPIVEILKSIEKQTQMSYALNKDVEVALNSLSINVKSVSVPEALTILLDGTGYAFTIKNQTITIYKSVEAKPAPELLISGRVSDFDGVPLVGATILIKGGKASDAVVSKPDKGEFTIKAPSNATLVFTFIGMETKEVRVNNQTNIDVQLNKDSKLISDVVVTGYANLNRESFTGNTVQINREDLLSVSQKDIIGSLQVFDPSLRFLKDNLGGSDPNKMPEFYVRGQSGIGVKELDDIDLSEAALTNNPNLPIFIMDGFEVTAQKVYDYDPYQIESITILKDAAATAMYGSRAANGVIVIETVEPKPGKLSAYYNLVTTFTFPDLRDYNLMNAREKLEAERLGGFYSLMETDPESTAAIAQHKEYLKKLNNINRGVNTDWIAQPLQNVVNLKHSLRVDGGGDNVRLGLVLKYDTEDGVMKKSQRDRKEIEFTASYRLNSFQISNRISYARVDARNSPYGSFSAYTKKLPYDEIYDINGRPVEMTPSWHVGMSRALLENPIYEAISVNNYDRSKYDQIINNLSLVYRINNFQVKGQLSITSQKDNSERFLDPASNAFVGSENVQSWSDKGSLDISNNSSFRLNANLVASYVNTFGKHNINGQAGLNIIETKNKGSDEKYKGFPSGSKSSPNYAHSMQSLKPYYRDNHTRLFGAFAAVNYSFENIYLLDASVRLDGSSEFGSDKKYAPFWSVGAGLNLHNYSFLKDNSVISKLKLTATTGELGKVNFSPYVAMDTYLMLNDWYPTGIGAKLMAMGNPFLTWETTRTSDFGLDIGFLKDNFNLKVAYYNKVTSNLVNDIDLIASSGFSKYKGNVGEVSNKGFELDFRANVYTSKDVIVAVYGNFATNKNKIINISSSLKAYNDLVDSQFDNYENNVNKEGIKESYSRPFIKYIEGGSLTDLFGMQSLGINPMDGKEIFLKKDGTITYDWNASDQVKIGNTSPKGQGAFGLNVFYKGFSLFASFLYEFGGQEYNQTLVNKVENANIYETNNDRRALTERWRQIGDISAYKDIKDTGRTTRPTSRFIQDYNAVTFNSLSVGYTFDKKHLDMLKLTALKISINANNLGAVSSVKQERGLSYPFARSFDITLNVGI